VCVCVCVCVGVCVCVNGYDQALQWTPTPTTSM